jgi:uncharacterized protein YhfF
MADELAGLVLAGTKTATCWVKAGGPSAVGERGVMLDGAGRPRAILETIEIKERLFDEVDAAFAFDEGEGDRTLAYWRKAHEEFFTRHRCFTPDMPLWCERFRVVAIIKSHEVPAPSED